MIKFLFALSALVAVVVAEDTYSTKYDNVNIDEILGNPRLYGKYIACLLDEPNAKCTPDAKMLKETIPDALVTDCKKCSEKQKQNAEKIINYMVDNKDDDYKKLEAIYDKDQVYRKKYSHKFKGSK